MEAHLSVSNKMPMFKELSVRLVAIKSKGYPKMIYMTHKMSSKRAEEESCNR